MVAGRRWKIMRKLMATLAAMTMATQKRTKVEKGFAEAHAQKSCTVRGYTERFS